jgi:hypothetical protein
VPARIPPVPLTVSTVFAFRNAETVETVTEEKSKEDVDATAMNRGAIKKLLLIGSYSSRQGHLQSESLPPCDPGAEMTIFRLCIFGVIGRRTG